MPITPSGQTVNVYTGITGTLPVSGIVTASIANFPAVQTVTGSVYVLNAQGSDVRITGSTITLPVSITNGITASIDNFPVTQSVYVTNQTSSSLSGVNVSGGALPVFSTQALPVWITGSGMSTQVYVAGGDSVCDTGTLASVAYSTASTLLLAANTTRGGLVAYNYADKELFIGTTNTTTTSSFSYRIAARAEFEMPPPLYRGALYGVWAPGGSGSALVTEYISVPVANDPLTLTASINNFPASPSLGNITSVPATGTGILLTGSNANRKGLTVYNNGSTNLYVSLGGAASTASFNVILVPSAYYEGPFSFLGDVSGAWSGTPTGDALIGEVF